jgi:hypothetical protein
MKKILFLLMLLLPAAALGQQPFLRARLAPGNRVIVGQPLRLEVEVFVPNYFTGAPEYPPFEMDGAIVTLSEDRPEHLNEQKNGITYAGIRSFYLIYPEQPGTFSVPSFQITAPYASAPPATSMATLNLPPLNFVAALPEAAQGLDYFLPTTQLTLRQEWSGPLTHLHVGDSVSRTIVITAQRMQAMLIPPQPFAAPDGVRVYTKNPSVANNKSPVGEFLAGVRTESASYVFTQAGNFMLPAIEITWWDLNSQKLKISRLPAVSIHVDAAGGYTSELPPQAEPTAPIPPKARNPRKYLQPLLKSGLALILFTALVFALRRWGPLARRFLLQARGRWRDSESWHWHRFKRALLRNNAPHSYAFLLAWLHRAYPGMTLSEFQRLTGDPHINQQLQALTGTLYGTGKDTNWSGQSLRAALSRHRKAAASGRVVQSGLPPLNPI